MGVSADATVKSQTGGFYHAEFDDFSISKGTLHFYVICIYTWQFISLSASY